MSLQDEVKKAVNWQTPSIDGEDTVHEAITQMTEHDVSAFIVKMNDVVTGILSDIDLVSIVVKHNDLHAVKVAEVMTPCALVTEEGTANLCAQIDQMESVENALKVLEAAGTHNLLVAGPNESDAGLVSINRLLKLVIT